jgi:hypothetical protein
MYKYCTLCNTVQYVYNTVQYILKLYSIVQYCTVLYSIARYCVQCCTGLNCRCRAEGRISKLPIA